MFRAAGPGSAAERILGEITRTTSQMLIVFNLVLSIALSQDFTNGEYDFTTLKRAPKIVIILVFQKNNLKVLHVMLFDTLCLRLLHTPFEYVVFLNCQALVPSPVLLDTKPNPNQSKIKIQVQLGLG